MVEGALASMWHFLHNLDPDIRKITRRLEHLHLEILKRKHSMVFNQTCLYIYIYIYICIYILPQYMAVTISLSGFVEDQMQYNLECVQYL